LNGMAKALPPMPALLLCTASLAASCAWASEESGSPPNRKGSKEFTLQRAINAYLKVSQS
jgi:hypothetical protein